MITDLTSMGMLSQHSASDDRGRLQREVKRCYAALEKAAGELVALTVRAPAHGKVIKIDATVGESPAPGTAIVVIQPE